MAKSYKVTVIAGTKVVADMAQQVKNSTIEASIQIKTVKGGATSASATILPPGPAGANRKMEDVEGWFVNGTAANPPVATGSPWQAPSGFKNTNWWDGNIWGLGASAPLPKNTLSSTVNQDVDKAITPKGVQDYSLPVVSLRALPFNFEALINDRPDIDIESILVVDKNGFFLPTPYVDRDSDKILPNGFSYTNDDRPDIDLKGVIVLDQYGNYIPQNGSNLDIDPSFLTYKYFGEMEGYPVETVKNPDDYWALWEEMRTADPDYVSSTPMRSSSLLDIPIWRYDFKPKKPKIKIIMIGCSHGWEKNISFGWARLMKQLVNDWKGNDALTFIRQNVHFITLPLLSPDNFVRNPFNGLDRTRSRQNYETKWINASFVANGNEINISYLREDFPANELHNFDNYFIERKNDIIGKTGVTVIDSTNTDAVKHNNVYRLKTVIGPGNIILENDITVSGSVSGTLKMCVRVDPERNYPTSSWANFKPGTPTSAPITYYDNKGTKPISTNENANAMDLINENPDISTIIDLHSGAGDYVTYIDQANPDKSFSILNDMFESLFGVITSTPSTNNPMSNVYVSETLGIAATLPEWHSSEPPGEGAMNAEQATELHNWIGNILYISSLVNVNINSNKL